MRYKKLLPLLLIVVLALILVWTIFLPESPRIIILHNPDAKETVYSLEDKSLSLTTDDREGSEHYLSLRSKSKLSLQEQVAVLSVMLNRIPKERRFRTFSVGRLINAFGDDRSLSERLTRAAAKSPLWDQSKVAPRTNNENNFVRDIANQAQIYPELKEMFARHGYEIRIAYVEKVLIDPQTKLPFDCITWFSLSRP
jgi:hypothetical protein